MSNTQQKGYWLPVETTPAEMVTQGPPKVGDPVIITYEQNKPIHTGTVKTTGSATDTNKQIYKAPEYGATFVLSPLFGIF